MRFVWSGREDLNLRPLGPEPSAPVTISAQLPEVPFPLATGCLRGSTRGRDLNQRPECTPFSRMRAKSGAVAEGLYRTVHFFHGPKRVLQAWPDRGAPGSQGQVDVGVRRRKRGGRHSGRARRRTRHGRGRARGHASRFGSGHPGVTGRDWREARGGGSESTSPLPDRPLSTVRPTAFVLPGGFIFIARSLVQLCNRNKDDIAFVLAHEMAHVIRRHAIERLLQQKVVNAVTLVSPARGALASWIRKVGFRGLEHAYSQDEEFEADELGVLLMRAAGFDPAGAIRTLQCLGKLDRSSDRPRSEPLSVDASPD